MNPKISIITICYNAEQHIEEAILSVINQPYMNKEYIIIDGGSTDGTLNIIDKYKNKISLVISEKDDGISDAFNKGIRYASGDLIGICNADDKLVDDSLANIASKYERGIDIFRFQEYIFNDEKKICFLLSPTKISRIPIHNHLLHMGCWITKDAYQKFGLYDIDFKYCMDYELIRRFLYMGAKEKYFNVPVGFFRGGGVSQSGDKRIETEKMEICRRYGGGVIGGYIWIFYERLRLRIKKLINK